MSANKDSFASMLKMGLILAVYSVIACVGLAYVYDGTAKIIAQRQMEDLDHALRELFPEADSFEAITGIASSYPLVSIEGDKGNPKNTGAFNVLKNGQTIGAALRTSRFSYSGPIKILVGVGTDGKIHGVKILQNTDTPGLGSNAGSKQYYVDRANGVHFYDQFTGKDVGDAFVPKQDVAAITASTITSRAVAESVKAAGEAASAWFAKGGIPNGGHK